MSFISFRGLISLGTISKIIRSENVAAQSINSYKIFSNPNALQVRNYAARKGTRARKEKKKVKKEVEKVGFIPHNLRNKAKMLALRPSRKFDDSYKRLPIDDVFNMKYYQSIVYSFEEAVKCHKETHHPSMYNVPHAPIQVTIELNMEGEKKTRFLDDFYRIVAVPNKFDHGEERSIIVFSKDLTAQNEAKDAGANLAGGIELIKQIQNGAINLQDFEFVISHPDILPELVSLRGLMKRKFPNPKNGTLDIDVGTVVSRFLHGVNYAAKKDEHEKDFGIIETVIGKVNMSGKELEENFAALIKDVYSMKPRREGTFITRCLLLSPPSSEKLKVDHNVYLEIQQQSPTTVEEEKQEGETVAL